MMSAPTKELLGRFPIDLICFVLSTGLFLTLASPIDLLNLDFSNGLNINIADLWSYLKDNFTPFITLRHFGTADEFPQNLAKILLISILPGILMYFLHDFYDRANHRLMGGRVKKLLEDCGIIQNLRPDSDAENRSREDIRFNKWARKEGQGKYIDFLYSMRQISTGLLYAIETFSSFTLVITISFGMLAWNWVNWKWMITAFSLPVLFYLVYIAYEIQFMRRFRMVWRAFTMTIDEERRAEEQASALAKWWKFE